MSRVITASTLIAISGIIFIASVIRGFTGFGLALVAVPLVQFFMPVTDTAVFIAIVNLVFSILYNRRSKKVIIGQPLGSMAIFTVIGVAAGALILKYIPSSWKE